MVKTLALVLKKQNFSETDRIITIFSPVLGKKRVVARAVRKPLSKLASHLDTLMISQLMLTDEPNLPKVTAAVLAQPFIGIRGSLGLMNRAFAVLRLVERVIIEDHSQRSLFYLTVTTLGRIQTNQPWPLTWLYFLHQLLHYLGVGVNQFDCQRCNQPLRCSAYWLQDKQWRCEACYAAERGETAIKLSPNALKLLYLMRRRSYDSMIPIRLPADITQELEELFLREVTQWSDQSWRTFRALDDFGSGVDG